jgi:hypothetical protein
MQLKRLSRRFRGKILRVPVVEGIRQSQEARPIQGSGFLGFRDHQGFKMIGRVLCLCFCICFPKSKSRSRSMSRSRAYMYVCTYVHMYVCKYVCMYVCTSPAPNCRSLFLLFLLQRPSAAMKAPPPPPPPPPQTEAKEPKEPQKQQKEERRHGLDPPPHLHLPHRRGGWGTSSRAHEAPDPDSGEKRHFHNSDYVRTQASSSSSLSLSLSLRLEPRPFGMESDVVRPSRPFPCIAADFMGCNASASPPVSRRGSFPAVPAKCRGDKLPLPSFQSAFFLHHC